MRHIVIPGLDTASYARHALHGEQNVWVEKNCYIDLWIEILHALKLEPLAMLPFTAAIDFEGDQWTFFKPPHAELFDLYGVDVQELTIWRPLLEHAAEHLAAGRLISTEADAFWLPDTSGTDYRRQHTKTTIVLNDLDTEQKRLGYFHNAGYYRLEGEDFIETFRLNKPHDPTFMPLFAEAVRTDRRVARPPQELTALGTSLWRRHLARMPLDNPIPRFEARFNRDILDLQSRGLPFYHAWAFATTRQLGAAFELAASNLRWLKSGGIDGLDEAAAAFDSIATLSKSFILKGARVVGAKRPFDGTELFAQMAAAWTRGAAALHGAFG